MSSIQTQKKVIPPGCCFCLSSESCFLSLMCFIDSSVKSGGGRGGWEGGLGRTREMKTAPHSSILAWRIPWTEEPSRLQSTGLQESDTT